MHRIISESHRPSFNVVEEKLGSFSEPIPKLRVEKVFPALARDLYVKDRVSSPMKGATVCRSIVVPSHFKGSDGSQNEKKDGPHGGASRQLSTVTSPLSNVDDNVGDKVNGPACEIISTTVREPMTLEFYQLLSQRFKKGNQ